LDLFVARIGGSYATRLSCGLGPSGVNATTGEEGEQVPVKEQTQDQNYDGSADPEMRTVSSEAPSATVIPAILNIIAYSTRFPIHTAILAIEAPSLLRITSPPSRSNVRLRQVNTPEASLLFQEPDKWFHIDISVDE
jgi:hypothetical protein